MSQLPMKALSIKQPWAWLIVHGHKDIENRDWNYASKFRGEFAVHASKSFDIDGYNYVKHVFPDIKMPEPNEFQLGGIVGIANMVDCVRDHESVWFMGYWGFVLTDAKPCDFYPCRGQLGFFEVPK